MFKSQNTKIARYDGGIGSFHGLCGGLRSLPYFCRLSLLVSQTTIKGHFKTRGMILIALAVNN